MFSRARIVVLAVLCEGMVFCALAAPTRLQVMVTSDKQKALLIAGNVNQAGFGPAVVDQAPGRDLYRVMTRSYNSYAEANFDKPRLRGLGYNDVFAVQAQAEVSATTAFEQMPSIEKTSQYKSFQLDFSPKIERTIQGQMDSKEMDATSDFQAPADKLLLKAQSFRNRKQADDAIKTLDALTTRFPSASQAAKAKILKGYWLVEKGDSQAAKAQFESVIREHPLEQQAGEAALRIGYLLIREKAANQSILEQFLKVAKGSFPATSEVRLEAMLRCAALYHRGKDLETAESAYRQIERIALNDQDVRAFAQMQRAGIVLEKAWNKKAKFADAREICDDLLKNFPAANKQVRSTAAIMAMETFCYEGNYAPVLDRAKPFLSGLDDTPEAPLAYYWIAKARLETGDAQGAADLLEEIIGAQFDTSKRFKKADVNPAARRLAADAYVQLGKPDRATAVLQPSSE